MKCNTSSRILPRISNEASERVKKISKELQNEMCSKYIYIYRIQETDKVTNVNPIFHGGGGPINTMDLRLFITA